MRSESDRALKRLYFKSLTLKIIFPPVSVLPAWAEVKLIGNTSIWVYGGVWNANVKFSRYILGSVLRSCSLRDLQEVALQGPQVLPAAQERSWSTFGHRGLLHLPAHQPSCTWGRLARAGTNKMRSHLCDACSPCATVIKEDDYHVQMCWCCTLSLRH